MNGFSAMQSLSNTLWIPLSVTRVCVEQTHVSSQVDLLEFMLQLQYKHVIFEHVPGPTNTLLTFFLPLGFVILISIARRSAKEAHFAVLAIFSGYELNEVATSQCISGETLANSNILLDFIKMLVGRLRPDFFDRCQYDAAKKLCTGIPAVVMEGRRSFPSGHSSSSFFGCVFLMLFLAGKNRAFTYSSVFPGSGILKSKLLRVCISVSPLFLSTFVAVSRWQDHWHAPTDSKQNSLHDEPSS